MDMHRLLALLLLMVSATAMAADGAPPADGTNAELTKVEGEVLVLVGDKYVPAYKGMRLKDGDRLMLMAESEVRVAYDDGCDEGWRGERVVELSAEQCIICIWGGDEDDENKDQRERRQRDGKDALIQAITGNNYLTEPGPRSSVFDGLRVKNGDILDLGANSGLTISYDNGCSEPLKGKLDNLVVDACRCVDNSPRTRGQEDGKSAELKELKGTVLLTTNGQRTPAFDGMRVTNGDTLELDKKGEVKIVFDHGCDEKWYGELQVKVDECNCAVPFCPWWLHDKGAVFGNMTANDVIVGGVFTVGGVLIVTDRDPPPVSP